MYYIRNWVYKSPNNHVDDGLSKRGEGEKENVHCKDVREFVTQLVAREDVCTEGARVFVSVISRSKLV